MTKETTLYRSSSRTIYPSFDHLLNNYSKKVEVDLGNPGERSTQNEKWFKELMKQKGKAKK
ncbi:MAG: hypothetical protein AAGA85_14970 [Bacteroidota bacterium]